MFEYICIAGCVSSFAVLHTFYRIAAKSKWLRFVLIACVVNGVCALYGRILQGWGLNQGYRLEFLSFWFGSGAVVALVVMLAGRMRPVRAEVLIGLGGWGRRV